MNFIVNNWELIAAILSIIIVTTVSVYKFFKKNKTDRLEDVKKWLLLAVTNAEKELGSGTGQLKLRSVYDEFVSKFPWVAKVTTFDEFSNLVDKALEEMDDMLKSNKAVQSYVGGIYTDKEAVNNG